MHPLGTDLSGVSDDELQKKYAELQKRMTQCYRFGPASVIPQLQMLLADYNYEIQQRNQKMMNEIQQRAEKNGKGYKGIIDIS